MRRATLAVLLIAWLAVIASAEGLALIDRLGTSDRAELARVVTEIERAPTTTPDLDEALFAAARACEDSLADPARALALYDRLLREFPDARRSSAAKMRADQLRDLVGANSSHAREAGELAQLIASADRLAPTEVMQRAERLTAADWPGAPEAGLWLAEWLRRNRRFDEAQRHYAAVARRWPDTSHAYAAIRGAAGCAIDARDWDLAERLATVLPAYEDIDRVMREELLAQAARGRRLAWWYGVSWIALIAAGVILVASLLEAWLRGPRLRRVEDRGEGQRTIGQLRPPIEVLFLFPIAAVLVGVAMTTHELIAPAVFWLSIGGLAVAWTSGAALDLLREHGRPVRTRAVVHALAASVTVSSLLYILLLRDNLLDMLIETVRFGPSG